MVKTFLISLNMMHMQLKLLMLHLALVASVHVVLDIQFSSVYLSPKWTRSCKHMVYAKKK
jgi:hypothetical protein